MCARRFLAVIFVLTLLVVAAAFAIFQFGGNVLLKSATPKGHFEAARAGSGPDYAQASNWLARPGMPNNPADWLPEGQSTARLREAAVFYVHPTTYLATDRWNAPLVADATTEFRTRLFVQSQASAFAQAGEVWAPRYRQAAYGAFLLNSGDAQQALDLAYADVSAAFDAFLKQAGDRPIILAGHSQGALHLERLIRDKVAGTPIAARIAAAYVVGWPISTTADLPKLGLPACTSKAEAGCILSWMTFGDPPNGDLIFKEWEKTTGFTGGKRRQEETLCVNPISGSKDGAAPAADNAGTLVPTTDLRSATLEPKAIGARCEKGLLVMDGQPPKLGAFVLPGNNYHVYDYALFWGSIAQDASERVAAWQNRR